ncbi:hypothetical protein [Dactylosporangium salmoneum]|uniref:Uncharacterized protein n=1 Tax=Dactylosporangium salmoneum TaxID=53361 RepID=A0ABP5U1W9_9ACTN
MGLVALLAVSLAYVLYPDDPRAYPGSDGGESLDRNLARAHMVLPACGQPSARYAAHWDGLFPSYLFQLRFTASPGCVDEFLQVNHYTALPEQGVAFFVSRAPAEYGWPSDQWKKYTIVPVAFETTSPIAVLIAIDSSIDPSDVFVKFSSG